MITEATRHIQKLYSILYFFTKLTSVRVCVRACVLTMQNLTDIIFLLTKLYIQNSGALFNQNRFRIQFQFARTIYIRDAESNKYAQDSSIRLILLLSTRAIFLLIILICVRTFCYGNFVVLFFTFFIGQTKFNLIFQLWLNGLCHSGIKINFNH